MSEVGRLHASPEILLDLAEGSIVDLVWKMHVSGCAVCSERLRELRESLAALETVEIPDPGESYWDEFGARLHERLGKKSRSSTRVARWAWAWAAVVLVGIAAWVARFGVAPTSAPPDSEERMLPPAQEDAEFQFLRSVSELAEEQDLEEVFDLRESPILDPSQLSAEEQEQFARNLERDMEAENDAKS